MKQLRLLDKDALKTVRGCLFFTFYNNPVVTDERKELIGHLYKLIGDQIGDGANDIHGNDNQGLRVVDPGDATRRRHR